MEKNGTITTYEYDLNGNRIADSNGSQYGYDEENLLAYASEDNTASTYGIGTDGLRNTKTTADSSTNYVTDQDGNVIREGTCDIIRGHQALAKRTENGTYYYYIYNAHGDVVMLLDESGNVQNRYQYDAWGKITSETETVPNSIKYAGEYYDKETGFIYLRNRMYDPATRRFTSEDPARDQLNWYVYCGNNPVMYVDPWGMFGKNTKLSYNQNYNPDVYKLQRRLVALGYLDMSDNQGWGYFGPKTQTAVNKYKNDNGLWNFGDYKGVVGRTTWEHMGLKVDNAYEKGGYTGTPESYGRGVFTLANGPTIANGLALGSIEAGIAKIGGEYKYGSWEIDAVNADAAAGFTANYIGAQAGARLISAGGGFKIPIPFSSKSIYIGAEGELFGIGFKTYYKDGKLKIGITALVGANVTLGIE